MVERMSANCRRRVWIGDEGLRTCWFRRAMVCWEKRAVAGEAG